MYSEIPHYLDFKFILNNSTAGKKVQDSLQKRLKNGVDLKYKRKITSRRRKENDSTKKVISQEEYVKKVKALRKKYLLPKRKK